MYSKNEIIEMLKMEGEEKDTLFQKAYNIKLKYIGKKVYFRGIVEFSNICIKDCYYCGIRKSNNDVKRFTMTKEEIIETALWAYENNYGSVVLQSGERDDEEFIEFIENILIELKQKSNNKLGITLSLGEQSEETYKRWYQAGAHRYLLRIEVSNRQLYKKLHPPSHDFDKRVNCLKILGKLGYQVGTGVMIGLPFQTIENLAEDILFFKEMDIDMIGMGPYVVHPDTPLAKYAEYNDKDQLELALKMIAVTRIVLEDVNIASTTALQALDPFGREMGIQAGANIIMPNITDTKYRGNYKLYANKPCTDENYEECRNCLQLRISRIGEEIGFNEWGDSPHYFKKNKK